MIFYFKDQIYSDHSIQAHLRLLLSESVSAKKSSVELSLGISKNFQKFQKLSIVLRMKFSNTWKRSSLPVWTRFRGLNRISEATVIPTETSSSHQILARNSRHCQYRKRKLKICQFESVLTLWSEELSLFRRSLQKYTKGATLWLQKRSYLVSQENLNKRLFQKVTVLLVTLSWCQFVDVGDIFLILVPDANVKQ